MTDFKQRAEALQERHAALRETLTTDTTLEGQKAIQAQLSLLTAARNAALNALTATALSDQYEREIGSLLP